MLRLILSSFFFLSLAFVTLAQPPYPPTPEAVALQQAINMAIQSGSPSYTIPSGNNNGNGYNFGNVSFVINNNTAPFYLNGNGTTFIFYPGSGVMIQYVSNVTVQGITVVYSPSCFTQGVIVATNPAQNTVDVQIEKTYPFPDTTIYPYFSTPEIKIQFFDNSTRLRLPNQPGACLVNLMGSQGNNIIRVQERTNFGLFFPAPGTLVSLSPRIANSSYEVPNYYKGQAWTVYRSEYVTSLDITITGSGNFAVLEYGGNGNHIFDNVRLIRGNNGEALLSSNTDGFHSFSTGTGATIRNSYFSFHGDDSLNFHNRVQLVLDPPSMTTDGTVHVIDVGDVPSPEGGCDNPARSFDDIVTGDSLKFFVAADGPSPLRGEYLVNAITKITNAQTIARAQSIVAQLPGVTVDPTAVAVWSIQLQGSTLDTIQPKDIVQFDRRSSMNGYIYNTTFTDSYDSCFRMQSSGTIVSNTSFIRHSYGMTIVYDPSWLEGSAGINNVGVTNNQFIAIGDPPAKTIQDILHIDNNVVNVTVDGNTVLPN